MQKNSENSKNLCLLTRVEKCMRLGRPDDVNLNCHLHFLSFAFDVLQRITKCSTMKYGIYSDSFN